MVDFSNIVRDLQKVDCRGRSVVFGVDRFQRQLIVFSATWATCACLFGGVYRLFLRRTAVLKLAVLRGISALAPVFGVVVGAFTWGVWSCFFRQLVSCNVKNPGFRGRILLFWVTCVEATRAIPDSGRVLDVGKVWRKAAAQFATCSGQCSLVAGPPRFSVRGRWRFVCSGMRWARERALGRSLGSSRFLVFGCTAQCLSGE